MARGALRDLSQEGNILPVYFLSLPLQWPTHNVDSILDYSFGLCGRLTVDARSFTTWQVPTSQSKLQSIHIEIEMIDCITLGMWSNSDQVVSSKGLPYDDDYVCVVLSSIQFWGKQNYDYRSKFFRWEIETPFINSSRSNHAFLIRIS